MTAPTGGRDRLLWRMTLASRRAPAYDVGRLTPVTDSGAADWRQTLTELASQFHRPMPLRETERIEAVLKTHLRELLGRRLSGDEARFLARWQRDLGFLLKYKSYGIKCATPLGYSVFLQNSGEGFSFQRHLTHKTEVFHILEPLEKALVFLCRSEEWEAVYATERLERWLGGAADAELDCFAKRPQAGDVYHVDELGLVHTVLGCVLEEFATISTDHVDRLHDQNAGRHEPHIARDEVVARLRSLGAHAPLVDACAAADAGAIVRDGDLQAYCLATGEFEATRLHLARGRVDLAADPSRARVLFTVSGSASCILRGDDEDASATIEAIDVEGGDLLLLAPGIEATIGAEDGAVFSIHAIAPAVALV